MKGLLYNNFLRKIFVVTPPLLWMGLLLLLPMIIIMAISVSEYAISAPPYKLFFGYNEQLNQYFFNPTAENFQILFEDFIYLKSFFNSIKFAFLTTIFTLLFGYPIALGIANSFGNSKNLLLTLIILPFWTSLIIRVYAWKTILGYNGVINSILLKLGLIGEPIEFLYNQTAVIIGLVYCYLPFMIFPLFIAIERIDKNLIEAAQDLGYSPFQSFLKVTLPLSKPGIIAGCMLVFIPVIGEYVVPDLLGGGKVVNIGKIIWFEFFQNKDWPVAAAVTVILLIIFIIPFIIIQRFISKVEEDE